MITRVKTNLEITGILKLLIMTLPTLNINKYYKLKKLIK